MFWDLRAQSLEAQALEPIKTLEEMRGDTYTEANAIPSVVARLNAVAEYRNLFARAFGGVRPITGDQLGQALATFQRSLTASNAPFDRYMRGEAAAMSDAQLRGMRRFQRVGCINCHRGPMFSDYQVHVLGVPDNAQLPVSDAGVDQTYAFRTASLRNLAYTAPYMHSGIFDSLRDVLDFYDDVSGRRGPRAKCTRKPRTTGSVAAAAARSRRSRRRSHRLPRSPLGRVISIGRFHRASRAVCDQAEISSEPA
jgi:cytochrome c peroxidase